MEMEREVLRGNYTGVVLTEGGYVAAAVTLFVIGLAGCLFNAVVIVMIWKYKQVIMKCNNRRGKPQESL